MSKSRVAFAFSLAAALPLAAGPTFAAAAGLAPHRAVYVMSLASSGESADVASASGRMVIEWHGSACDGFVTRQRVVNNIGDKEGGMIVSDFRINSWESADGDTFNFSLVHYLNGSVVDEIEGEAERDADGGKAVFASPDKAPLKLPAGIVFPTEYMRVLANAAEKHTKVVESRVFDGSEASHVFATTAIFGEAGAGSGGKTSDDASKLLSGVGYWPVQLSYFNPESRDGVPEYEVTFRLYENGVSTGLLMDYGNMVLSGDLVELEFLPVPDC